MNSEVGGFGAFVPLLIIIVIYIFFRSRSSTASKQFTSPTLVLREFDIAKPDSDRPLITIRGRASGLISWLFTVIGINSETSLIVSQQSILFRSASLYGETQQVVPFSKISSTQCGYYKPITYLLLAGIILVLGIGVGLTKNMAIVVFISLVLAALFLIAYWLSKQVSISIETFGGMVLTIRFKRSVVENVPVDIEIAKNAIDIISYKVVEI